MKKIVLVIIMSVIFMFNLLSVNADNRDEMNLINEYFAIKDEIMKTANIDEIEMLNNYFVDNNNAYLEYEKGRLEYLVQSDIISDSVVDTYISTINILSIKKKGSKTIFDVEVDNSIKYDYMKEVQSTKTLHSFTLKRVGDDVKILKDEYSDEFKTQYNLKTDFSNLIKDLEVRPSTFIAASDSNNAVSINSVPGDYYDTYSSTDRNRAVTYAMQYTDDSGTTSTTNYNNSQFKSYGSYDCQNFVSQCIWAGFGGTSSSAKDLPMTNDWWANLSGETSTWNWTGTSYFYDWITDNYSNNDYGIRGYSTSVSNIQAGDYVYVPGHVLFISSADDIDEDGTVEYNEIYICAHTNNRRDHSLAALYGSVQPSNMEFLRIVNFKWNTGI